MKNILIVDDSQLTRNYHSYIVNEAGFAVTTAVDGADGLEKFLRQKFDLVLTDINMQRMDGYEFIRRVRQDRQFNHVPIIIISTENADLDRQKGFSAGASLYLTKPLDASRMVESIKMVLGDS